MSLHVDKTKLQNTIFENLGSIVGVGIFLFGICMLFVLTIAVQGLDQGIELFRTFITPLKVPVQVIIPLAVIILLVRNFGSRISCFEDKKLKKDGKKKAEPRAQHRLSDSGNGGFLESSM
jgi:hypothetical protein